MEAITQALENNLDLQSRLLALKSGTDSLQRNTPLKQFVFTLHKGTAQ
ncbi:MAG: hypothetical protein ACI8V2_000110 [Candidatus Latescibacterota bacterium]|jgi:hypothetical protein